MSPSRPRFLMCHPRNYAIEYVINPWMDGNVGRARADAAEVEWRALHAAVAAVADVTVLEAAPGLPDQVFTANAGLVAGDVFVPSRYFYPQRQPETPQFAGWFAANGFKVERLNTTGAFEGEGDALFQPGERLIWAGYGVRTSLESHRDLAEIFDAEVLSLRMVDERFYHLDTCFVPLPGGRAFYYPAAFDHASIDLIRSRFAPADRFEVADSDAMAFACNAVVAGTRVITNHAGPELRAQLGAWGFEVVAVPLAQFLMAGGSAKCLALKLDQDLPRNGAPRRETDAAGVRDRLVELQGQLLDTGLMNEVLDLVGEMGGSFEIEQFQAGLRRDMASLARVRVFAPGQARLDDITRQLIQKGAVVVDAERDAILEVVEQDGVAPGDFYSTTIYPTDVRVAGGWVRVANQRMDVVVRVDPAARPARAECVLIRDLRRGERIVTGVDGIRIHARAGSRGQAEEFSFMSAGVSSERRVELAVDEVAWEMRRIRDRGGRIVVVAGPVVIHTGGGRYLADLVRMGFVQALLGGNAVAVHDMEENVFGTSLGVDLKRGVGVHGGHRHHLKVINMVRGCGGIARAVERGLVTGGVMAECVRANVPFVLAGSIRDDGPLPETLMDLVEAQRQYAEAIRGADMILMLCSMLHSIGTGNMTPGGVRLICVDISPAVVTKLADRGSLESVGIVTDVGLFLNLLAGRLRG